MLRVVLYPVFHCDKYLHRLNIGLRFNSGLSIQLQRNPWTYFYRFHLICARKLELSKAFISTARVTPMVKRCSAIAPLHVEPVRGYKEGLSVEEFLCMRNIVVMFRVRVPLLRDVHGIWGQLQFQRVPNFLTASRSTADGMPHRRRCLNILQGQWLVQQVRLGHARNVAARRCPLRMDLVVPIEYLALLSLSGLVHLVSGS